MGAPFSPILSLEELNISFDRYEIIDRLGEGGQGCVFKGLDQLSNHEVAIKVYSPHQLLKRAELEVNKLKKIKSPFLAEVIEDGNVNIRNMNCFYVVTKYVEGGDLENVLSNRNLSQIETKNLLICTLRAIDELWKFRVVHSDIKPANILSLSTGSYSLIDLGIAKHLKDETITIGNMIMGTIGYIAPEQLKGRRNLTLRADMFSLGVLAYEAVTGIHPFQRNQNYIFSNVKPTHITNVISIDNNLARCIHKLMDVNPLNRPGSGKKAISILEEDD